MACVYVDPSAVRLDEAAGGSGRALRELAELVDEVIILSESPLDGVELPASRHLADDVEAIPGEESWFITADPETLRSSGLGGVRTLLVGPRRAPGKVPLPRYDVEARDLPAAVMEIMTRQAMH